MAIQNGVVIAFAVLYLPLVTEFGASRGEVAAVQSAVLLLGGFGSPIIGWAFDRLGPRRLFQWGALLAAAGFVLASQAGSLLTLVIAYGFIAGFGLSMLGGQADLLVAALWYPRARGRAIAVADLGTGFGAFCFLPLGQALVLAYGWRVTLLAWAALLVVVVVPLNAFQRLPARLVPAPRSADAPAPWTVRDAVHSAPFWWLTLARFASAFAFPLMNTHVIAYAIGQGVTPAAAATALGAVSLVSLAGRLTTGWLSDRIGRAPTLTIMYTSAAIGIACLAAMAATGAPMWLTLYVVFYGMSQGSSGIVPPARAADIFAGASFGAIYGWLSLAIGPGEALGVWLGGRIFDATGSYLSAFALVVIALVIGCAAMWRVHAPGGATARTAV